MQSRQLGRTGISVAPLAFGGNVFGWTVDEQTAFRLLDEFTAAGSNLVDTADVYSKWVPGNQGGESEAIIGKWAARPGNRDKVVIATKVGMELAPDKKGLSRRRIMHAVEDSLRRLQTDHIDLYQSHTDDAETPIDETLGAYQELIRQGKVRAIGASNYTAPRLAEALRISSEKDLPRYESLQPNYNLYDRQDFEAELEPLCLREQVGVIPYFSLAKGFLSGKYRSEEDLNKSPRGQGVKQYLNERGFRILKALDDIAEQYETSPSSVAIAWLIARPSITAPITSATSVEQLQELTAAAQLKLDQAAIQNLDQASAY